MKKIAAFGLIILFAVGLFTNCEDIDNYSTNPNLRLEFSVDTLSFDTVFTTMGSATKRFMVYNQNSENLRISSVMLANPDKSGFRINVDGRSGDNFKDIDIWKKDSLYVSVEVTVDPNGKNQPLVVEDSILFYVNGIRQSVLLQAYGQDVRLYKGGRFISEDTTFGSDLPYLIFDSLVIEEGATATIQAGAVFYMHKKAFIRVDGTLNCEGTQDRPVLFRGDRLDYITVSEGNILYDLMPAQWRGIEFTANSFDNKFNYVIVRNGVFGLTFKESTPDRQKININNSQITNMSGNLLSAINCKIDAVNSEFSNAVEGVVLLKGGEYQFTHCSIINYIAALGGGRSGSIPVLTLQDSIKNGKQSVYYDLTKAYFDNCIIDGSLQAGKDPLKGELLFRATASETFNYKFNHCAIKTAKNTSDRFIDVLYSDSDTLKYLKKGTRQDGFAYDYRLANKSGGIGSADLTIAKEYPIDRYGVNRITSSYGPSLGAYQYEYQEEEKK